MVCYFFSKKTTAELFCGSNLSCRISHPSEKARKVRLTFLWWLNISQMTTDQQFRVDSCWSLRFTLEQVCVLYLS